MDFLASLYKIIHEAYILRTTQEVLYAANRRRTNNCPETIHTLSHGSVHYAK